MFGWPGGSASSARVLRLRERGRDAHHLERALPPDARVRDEVNRAHPALIELSLDAELSDAVAGPKLDRHAVLGAVGEVTGEERAEVLYSPMPSTTSTRDLPPSSATVRVYVESGAFAS